MTRSTLPCMGVLLASLALAACTPANVRPGETIATTIKAGQSWVITRQALAVKVLDACSRATPGDEPGRITGYWAPSRVDVEQLEARLPSLATQVPEPVGFDRQYVGIESRGQRQIYINAFHLPDAVSVDPSREHVDVCDGGRAFWGAVYDPATGIFSELTFNGALSPP